MEEYQFSSIWKFHVGRGIDVGYFDGALATMYRDGRRVYPLYIPYGNG